MYVESRACDCRNVEAQPRVTPLAAASVARIALISSAPWRQIELGTYRLLQAERFACFWGGINLLEHRLADGLHRHYGGLGNFVGLCTTASRKLSLQAHSVI